MLTVRICEYAAVHPDGTFMVLGGGLSRWRADRLPAALPLWALIEANPGALPLGRHPLRLRLRGEGGLVYAATDVMEVRREDGGPARAAQLYRRACESGHARGCFQLSELLDAGRGVPVDAERAAALRAQACAAGYERACR